MVRWACGRGLSDPDRSQAAGARSGQHRGALALKPAAAAPSRIVRLAINRAKRDRSTLMTRDARPERIELAEERLEISKRELERGRVVVRTRVETRDEIAEIELRQEDVTVDRVPRGVPVEVAPAVREEDGVLIVPVLEEQLVLTTRLILKEEIRITKRSRTEVVREPVQAAFRAGGHSPAGRPERRYLPDTEPKEPRR